MPAIVLRAGEISISAGRRSLTDETNGYSGVT
jgi:hypothetical protein